jgi:hypothetical protein
MLLLKIHCYISTRLDTSHLLVLGKGLQKCHDLADPCQRAYFDLPIGSRLLLKVRAGTESDRSFVPKKYAEQMLGK